LSLELSEVHSKCTDIYCVASVMILIFLICGKNNFLTELRDEMYSGITKGRKGFIHQFDVFLRSYKSKLSIFKSSTSKMEREFYSLILQMLDSNAKKRPTAIECLKKLNGLELEMENRIYDFDFYQKLKRNPKVKSIQTILQKTGNYHRFDWLINIQSIDG
jgi:serine/threonine protein kinase